MENKQSWEEANKWEHEWHGNCVLPEYNEVTKQYIYAQLMGLDEYATNYYGMRGWDFGDKAVIDFGGGPYSMLLRSKARVRVVVDPCDYPEWVLKRYAAAGVIFTKVKAEDFIQHVIFDECLAYNLLQHTEDPGRICRNMLACSRTVRVFDWIEAGISPGHIQNLTEANMNSWLKGNGKVADLERYPAVGKCYYGIFKGNHYAE